MYVAIKQDPKGTFTAAFQGKDAVQNFNKWCKASNAFWGHMFDKVSGKIEASYWEDLGLVISDQEPQWEIQVPFSSIKGCNRQIFDQDSDLTKLQAQELKNISMQDDFSNFLLERSLFGADFKIDIRCLDEVRNAQWFDKNGKLHMTELPASRDTAEDSQ